MKTHYPVLLILFFMFTVTASGQNFSFHSIAPFGIQLMHEDSSHIANKVMFFDFDGDDDLDLFLSGVNSFGDFESWETIEYFIEMQENIGDKWHPQFADRVEPFANFPFPTGYFFPAIGDVNNDGDPDFVIFGDVNFFGGRTILYLESDGRASAGFNVLRGEVFGLNDLVPESFFIPELLDLDVDGDLDVLLSGFDPAFAEEDGPDVPTFYYAQNRDVRSSTAVADFSGWHWNPYGLIPNPLFEMLTSGDIDNDGDIDLLGTTLAIPQDSINRMYVHVNTPGLNAKPLFDVTLEAPFGLPTSFGEEQFLFPDLVDLDSDGDLDLFVFKGTAQGNLLEYYENTMCSVTTEEVSFTICEGDILDFEGQQFSEAGTYEIPTIGTDGCALIITLFLEVEETPIVDLEETICAGESVQVGDEVFTEAGDYEVVLFTMTGCDSIVLLHLEVIDVDNTVSLEDETLTAQLSGAEYQWFNCDSGEDIPGANGQSFEVPETGSYAVRITDVSGCTEESECVFVMITSINEPLWASQISVFPNPSDDIVTIENRTRFPVGSIIMINTAGQEINSALKDDNTLDISALQPGVYFLKMAVNNEIVIKKLIVI